MINHSLKPYISVFLLMSMTACQPTQPTEKSQDNEASATIETKAPNETNSRDSNLQSQKNEMASTNENAAKVVIDKIAQQPASVDNTTTNSKQNNKATCDDISALIDSIDKTSKIEDIHHIDSQLPACLKEADHKTVITLLQKYEAMYDRFLSANDSTDYENFDRFINRLEKESDLSRANLDMLSPRMQYLVKLLDSEKNIMVKYWGEGNYSLSHNLQAMVALFSPYLPKDDKVFFERMAMDNQESFWNDAAINISYKALIERALFWERYMNTYPNSAHFKDAEALYKTYRYYLFVGSENTYWTDDEMHSFYDPENNSAMIDLSNQPNSQLAKDAEQYLAFLDMHDEDRDLSYPVAPLGNDSHEREPYEITAIQLHKALKLTPPWQEDTIRNCGDGVFCKDVDAYMN